MKTKAIRQRGVYLLPNLLTTSGLFAAFYAIMASFKGHFHVACIAVFIAMIADALDGRIARMTNTQTEFGAQYDSLADMVSFGLTPSVLVYAWSVQALGKLGWLVAFFYTAATALRLARFNVQLETSSDQRFFTGLPCPSAAAVVTSLVWLSLQYQLTGMAIDILTAFITLAVAVLMVSNLRFYSFKDIDFSGKVPFFAVIIVLIVFVGIAMDPPLILFAAFMTYAVSGPINSIMRLIRKRRRQKQA